MIRTGLIAWLLAKAAPAFAGAPELSLPIDCQLGISCFIQQYVDLDPGNGARDFTCGPLSYDKHKGTDIRLAFRRQIKGAGVRVLAAASGTVSALRDEMPDIAQGDSNAPDVTARECGNGVVLDHGEGWQTQYCHMRLGSISVVQGQKVKKGAGLGLVGLSGNTQFPHIHLQVLNGGAVVDPFHPFSATTCGDNTQQLWMPSLAYVPGGLLAAGFATAALDFDEIRQGPPILANVRDDAPALTFWGYFYGLRAKDVVNISITMPNGEHLIRQSFAIDRNRAIAYRLTGKKRILRRWPVGQYAGTVSLSRGGILIDTRTVSLIIR